LKQLSSLLKISVSVLLIFLNLTAIGGDPYRPAAGAGEAGMGYTCVMKKGFWSTFHNQALLSEYRSISVGINYQNRFCLKELGTRSIAVIIPVGKVSLGAVYSHFGYTDFKRQMTGIACGIKLSDKITAGVQIDYYSERTYGEYANNQTVTCETGLLITPSENLRIGIHLFNPVPTSINKTFLPTALRIGAGTTLSDVLFAAVEAEMSSGGKLMLKSGFEYEAVKNMRIMGGFITNDNSFSFGCGFNAKPAVIDLSFVTHEKLGLTSSISLIFKIH
jgi:hypothetical protein